MQKIGQNRWVLDDVLGVHHKIEPHHFDDAPAGVVDDFICLLSRDVFSEGDSQCLYNYLQNEGMSAELKALLRPWLQDELKHYQALRRCYRALSGVSYTEMDRQFDQRVHNVEPIAALLQDEFVLLLLFMFDEIGSTYSYLRDLREYYQYFGPEFKKVAHHLVRDEGMHFSNAAELLLAKHRHRLESAADWLQKIDILEKSLGHYHKAFFLDHAQEQHRFPKDFNRTIIEVILARLGQGPRPNGARLMRLWQWKPQGSEWVAV